MTESRENIDVISDDGWSELLAWLPEGFEEKMRDTGAFTRSRKIKQPTDLLRIVLAYPVLSKSLPNLSRWASEKGIADLSFISIWGGCKRWWFSFAGLLVICFHGLFRLWNQT